MPEASLAASGRILAIDDDPSLHGVFARRLADAGYRVDTVATLGEGLALAAALPFDACLLDGAGGDDAGLDALRRLREIAPDLRVIVVRAPAPAVGAPVTLDVLERRHIEAVVAGSHTLDAAARTLGIDSSTLYRKRKAYGL